MNKDLGQHKKWFAGVDSLRFILALVVLLSHFNDPLVPVLMASPHQFIQLCGSFLTNAFDGTAAVIAFFIISGFVIHYPNKHGIKNLKIFWIRRFTRVFIPLLVIFFIGIHFHHPEKAVVWSLICELIYYAVYPFLAMIRISWSHKFIISYIIAMLFIATGARHDVVSFFKQSDIHYHSYYWQLGSFCTWIVGLPVWLLGVLMAEKIDQLQYITFKKVLLYRVSIFILSCFFTIARSHLHLSYILSMNVFALLIYQWLLAEIIYFKNKQPNRMLEAMGKFSYSLYLCHPLIYLIAGIWINNSLITYPLFIIITLITSYLFYLGVERPAHLLALRLSKSNHRP